MSGEASDIPEPEADLNVGDEAILEQMDEVRGKLGGGIERLNEDVRNVFDWQSYVRAAPLTSVGIAVAVGYLLAPAIRSRPVQQFVPVDSSVKSGGIFSILTSLALTAATRVAGNYVTEMLSTPTSTVGPAASGAQAQPFKEDPYKANPGTARDQNFDLEL
jgi:hypothetical protein